ncbi:response regulator [Paenibacillus aestuarii]|uniref:Response regulator n=1 Tax=Paenibacillus aestuarii TaxID=516965 RepID=A0ABW0K7P1_9BACL|nr:response regulator [Paenibacillus aestuarii]
MLNILVVDDEVIQRRVLASIIREARPGCHVREAKNGHDALEVIHTTNIDIVFTDIKMPVLDGLEFIEKLNDSGQAIKVIILSGYRYFEYAQKAVQLGAFDYLLKPIKEDSICEILDKVESSIRKERESLLETQQIKKQLDRTLTAYYEGLLLDWIAGTITEAQREEICRQFALGRRGIVVTAKLQDAGQLIDALESENRVKSALLRSMEAQAAHFGPSVSFYSREDKQLLISVISLSDNQAGELAKFTQLLEQFAEQAGRQFGWRLTIGVGAGCDNIAYEVSRSFDEALTAISFRYFLPDHRVIQFTEISTFNRTIPYVYWREEEQFREIIRKNKSEYLGGQAEEFFAKLVAEGLPHPDSCSKTVLRMISAIATVMKDFVTEQQHLDLLIETEAKLSASVDYFDCKKKFLDTLYCWIGMIQKSRSRKHESVVETCIQYIDEHYMEDLSLDTVAAHFFFSPNYLGVMLKNHLGVTFSKYLSDVRIKKGIELLQNSDKKVYEVASQVGFKDDKYFYRVFKSKFGMTPDEYRRHKHVIHMTSD